LSYFVSWVDLSVDFRYADESELEILDDRIPMPLSLIVVTLTDTVLMVLNGQRGLWELPGGMYERGETTRQAAARELAEETRDSPTQQCRRYSSARRR
jgi:8-oxo-dGTP pyrophosphatase MutT (NUDIX family)